MNFRSIIASVAPVTRLYPKWYQVMLFDHLQCTIHIICMIIYHHHHHHHHHHPHNYMYHHLIVSPLPSSVAPSSASSSSSPSLSLSSLPPSHTKYANFGAYTLGCLLVPMTELVKCLPLNGGETRRSNAIMRTFVTWLAANMKVFIPRITSKTTIHLPMNPSLLPDEIYQTATYVITQLRKYNPQ